MSKYGISYILNNEQEKKKKYSKQSFLGLSLVPKL